MATSPPVLLLSVCILLAGPRVVAQPSAGPLEFETASVKPSDPAARVSNVIPGAGDSLTIMNVPLRKIVLYAYDIRDFQLNGAPGWMDNARFDIVAKSAIGDRATIEPADETDEGRRNRVARVRERLRSLLADRFGLQVHIEQREHTILELRIAKGGPKLAVADNPQGRVSTLDGHIQGYGAPISMLATQLAIATGLIVDDQTGLRGKYDFVLDFGPDERDQRDTRPSIFAAVVEQLGLRLERAKGTMQAVIVEHVERPSAN